MQRAGALVLIATCFVAGVSASARASLPGTNAKIVFLDNAGDVETYNPGNEAIALVFPSDFERPRYDPTWAPDGRTLSWMENSDLDKDDTDTAARVLLANGLTTQNWGSNGVWSPDGRIGGWTVDGTSHNTTPTVAEAWSPDGTENAYEAATHTGAGWDYTLDVSNADGSDSHAIADLGINGGYCSGEDNGGVDWSPDGTRIAYCNLDRLHVVTANGSSDRVLSAAPDDGRPTWSPDGSEIAFDTDGAVTNVLAVVNANLTKFRVLLTADGRPVEGEEPNWGRAPMPNPSPPANTSPPTIDGTVRYASALTVDPGAWSGDSYRFFTYVWQRCVSATLCSDIPGATALRYVPVPDDIGRRLRAEVTAVSAEGSRVAVTAVTSVVPTPASWPPAVIPPSVVSPPTITGGLVVGSTVIASPGTYDGTKPLTSFYEWYRCSSDGTFCTTLDALDYGPQPGSNAYGRNHIVEPGDAGSRLEVLVSVAHGNATTRTWSAPTAIVAPIGPTVSGTSLAWDGGSILLTFHLCDPTSSTLTLAASDTVFPRTRAPSTYSWTLPWSGGCEDVVHSWPAVRSPRSRHQVALSVTDAHGVTASDDASLDG